MARKFYKENNEALPAIAYELTAPADFTEITDSNELKALFNKKYKERTQDGQDYYNNFRSDLYIDITNGTITDAEAFALEAHIKPVSDNLLTGNWLTAQNSNTNLTLSGIYDQTMKDEIQADIDNYIANNY